MSQSATPANLAEQYLSHKQAAAILGIESQTMSKWACTGYGPSFIKLNPRLVRYKLSVIQAFLDAGDVRSFSTGQPAA